MINQRINQFPEENECFYPQQFGFRLNISTDNALTSIIGNIQDTLDGYEFAAGVFVGLKKTFDTVDHKMLIEKPEHCRVRGIAKQIEKQFVSVNNHKFRIQTILTRVPQNSILGPLLFLIFTSMTFTTA